MYIRRAIENTILEVSKSFPCIVVYGPRQVGKSTTLDYIFPENFSRVTLDNLDDRNLAEKNPKLFLEANPCPVIIDEIQKVPELLDEIKTFLQAECRIFVQKFQSAKSISNPM